METLGRENVKRVNHHALSFIPYSGQLIVKARELVFCSQQPYQLVSPNYMLVNIISCTHAPYFPYTLHREGQAISGVHKDAVCQSIKQPHKGTPRVSVKPTKVSKPPDYLLERVN